MRSPQDQKLAEFVALSKCLPTLVEKIDGEGPKQSDIRQQLAISVMTQMSQLLASWFPCPSKPTLPDVPISTDGTGPAVTIGDIGSQTTAANVTEKITPDNEVWRAERQLVQERILSVISNKLDDVMPADSPGTMIDIDADGYVRAYVIPDASSKEPLNIFRFAVQLKPID